jgi:hypothetical protein
MFHDESIVKPPQSAGVGARNLAGPLLFVTGQGDGRSGINTWRDAVLQHGYLASQVASFLHCHPSNVSRALQKN